MDPTEAAEQTGRRDLRGGACISRDVSGVILRPSMTTGRSASESPALPSVPRIDRLLSAQRPAILSDGIKMSNSEVIREAVRANVMIMSCYELNFMSDGRWMDAIFNDIPVEGRLDVSTRNGGLPPSPSSGHHVAPAQAVDRPGAIPIVTAAIQTGYGVETETAQPYLAISSGAMTPAQRSTGRDGRRLAPLLAQENSEDVCSPRCFLFGLRSASPAAAA
ncbi:hypothetical protein PVAR5_4719 [Paecilomyces variotii No. 5]|uniref:Uncharacterized protein n=1 Tax=Byssochlamys spectabilis (strain No. 5 / NBRC 109023) TaxID=1356009 RepID=V5I0N2_BYSSN|nr:hypothetical protein PVAR5_4719 [Paecilomyces variotii No. 5]